MYELNLRIRERVVQDKDTQKKVLAAGQSAYYIAIFLQQSFNLFICKARLGLPVGPFMFENKKMFLCVLVGAIVAMAVVYVPPFNIAFGTYYMLNPIVWLIPLGNGIILWVYAIVRTLVIRLRNPVKYSDDVYGLQMYPTRWSTGGAK
jgi:sodium/potassium-transporting ATPase subunit alpha